MPYPKTYRAWRRSAKPFPLKLVLSTETLPDTLGAKDVLIRIHAVSLNYRDAAMLEEGKYPVPVEDEGVSASDCAAEVVAVGFEVTKFTIGDHVTVTIDLLRLTGDDREMEQVALGGDGPGTLREFAIFEEKVLVRLPSHLSWVEVWDPSSLRPMRANGIRRGRPLLLQGSLPGTHWAGCRGFLLMPLL